MTRTPGACSARPSAAVRPTVPPPARREAPRRGGSATGRAAPAASRRPAAAAHRSATPPADPEHGTRARRPKRRPFVAGERTPERKRKLEWLGARCVRTRARAQFLLGRGAAQGASRGRRDLRRAHPPRRRHRRHDRATTTSCSGSWTPTASSRAFMFCMDEPDRHPGFQRRERPHARGRGALGGAADPVRPARPRRGPDRGGASAASTAARAGSSSTRGRSGFLLERRAARAGLRDRRRAPRADPDPRRARAAADRRRPRPPRRRAIPTRS